MDMHSTTNVPPLAILKIIQVSFQKTINFFKETQILNNLGKLFSYTQHYWKTGQFSQSRQS